MSYNLSGCVFVRNTFKGAFCLFESMHQLLPLCDEFIVMDLGSNDGTLEVLKQIEVANPKVKVVHGTFHTQDASVFADLANEVISMCNYPHVLYYQSDEIWHEDLVKETKKALDDGKRNLSFWRVQLKYNFQRIKWFPHPVHRVGTKEDLVFTNDGMNTGKTFDTYMVSSWHYVVRDKKTGSTVDTFDNFDKRKIDRCVARCHRATGRECDVSYEKKYDLEVFMQWGDRYKTIPDMLPTNEMILDVSLTGGFLDNIPDRRRMHLPFWNEPDVMPADEDGLGIDQWYNKQKDNHLWDLHETPFDIPEIMRFHLGRRKYQLRETLLETLKGSEQWR